MNLYICVYLYIHTTDMPFIHSCVYFSPIEEFVTCYSFPLRYHGGYDAVSKVPIFHENHCVYICGFIYIHIWQIHIHTQSCL